MYFKNRPIILTSPLAIDMAGAPLRFLGPGRYRAEIYADDQSARRLRRQTEEVTTLDSLKIWMESAGGYMARLKPVGK